MPSPHSLLLLLMAALVLSPPIAVALPATEPAAEATPGQGPARRLPAIHLHGNALAGAARNLSVEEVDRLALLTTWKILDPYKRAEARYTGITLSDLVNVLAPGATHVRMRAINDYVTEFERREWQTLPILVATRDGDSRMGIPDKGPARIVYLQTRENERAMQVHAPKWIWQIIDVEFQSR